MITPDVLNAVGEALYGPRWQSELAGDLDVAVRTMQRWAKSGAPDNVRDELKALLVKRGADVAKLIREI